MASALDSMQLEEKKNDKFEELKAKMSETRIAELEKLLKECPPQLATDDGSAPVKAWKEIGGPSL